MEAARPWDTQVQECDKHRHENTEITKQTLLTMLKRVNHTCHPINLNGLPSYGDAAVFLGQAAKTADSLLGQGQVRPPKYTLA